VRGDNSDKYYRRPGIAPRRRRRGCNIEYGDRESVLAPRATITKPKGGVTP